MWDAWPTYASIAELIKQNKFEKAVEFTSFIQYPSAKSIAMQQIVTALIKKGMLTKAKEILDSQDRTTFLYIINSLKQIETPKETIDFLNTLRQDNRSNCITS